MMPKPPDPTRLLLSLAALALLAPILAGCGTTAADPERGRELFIQSCGTCHALAEAGTTAQIGPDLDDAFGPARRAGMTDSTIAGVTEKQIEYPRPSTGDPAVSMPADIVTGQDAEDVAAYVGEWAGVPGAAPPEAPGGPGAQVFAANGCGGCHALAAANAGGVTGPDLDEVLPGQSAAMVRRSIVDPNAQIAAGYPPNVMPTNYGSMLSEAEIEDLVDYLLESAGKGGASR